MDTLSQHYEDLLILGTGTDIAGGTDDLQRHRGQDQPNRWEGGKSMMDATEMCGDAPRSVGIVLMDLK